MRFELAFAFALAACSPEIVPKPSRPPADFATIAPKPVVDAGVAVATQLERQIAAKLTSALSSPSFAGLDELLDDDAHFVFVGNKLDSHGRREVRAALEKLFGDFAPRTFAPRRVLLTDRSQAIEWTMTGEDKATHRPVGIAGIALVATRDDGTVSDLRVYFDEAVVHAQLGQEPKGLQSLALPKLPASPPEVIEQTHSADEGQYAKMLDDWLDNFEKQEAKYVAAMADDVVVETLESATPMKGGKDAHAYYQRMHKAIANIDTQLIPPPLAADGFIEVEYRIVGEMRDKIAFVPKLNVPLITLYVVDVVQMHDGKIAHVWRYEDPIQIVPDATQPKLDKRLR